MMLLLVLNVTNHRAKLGTRIRKRAKPLLPRKSSHHPMFLVDEFRRTGFHVAHQIGKCYVWFDADEQVHVIRHIVYRNQLLLLTGDDAGDVFLKFVVVFRLDEVLPAFDGEHNMEIDLRVGVGHASKMPLLTELENLFYSAFYKDFAPTALPVTSSIPKMVGQRVFVRDIGFKDGFELRPLRREFREFKRAPFLEADEKDAFAVLRQHALRVNDGRVQMVAERVGERVVDDLKRPALVVAPEVLNVLQHKRGGLVALDDFRQREEQVALLLVVKSVRLAEAQFFGDARDAERLAGKAGAKDVVGGNVRHRHGMDVAMRRVAEIGGVGLLRVFVPVGGEHAFAPERTTGG